MNFLKAISGKCNFCPCKNNESGPVKYLQKIKISWRHKSVCETPIVKYWRQIVYFTILSSLRFLKIPKYYDLQFFRLSFSKSWRNSWILNNIQQSRNKSLWMIRDNMHEKNELWKYWNKTKSKILIDEFFKVFNM